jgi:serine/threonine protein kinase
MSLPEYEHDKNGNLINSPLAIVQKASRESMMSSEEEDGKGPSIHKFEEKYEVKEKIGEGAHGVVSKCVRLETKKIYAVKTLRW